MSYREGWCRLLNVISRIGRILPVPVFGACGHQNETLHENSLSVKIAQILILGKYSVNSFSGLCWFLTLKLEMLNFYL